MGQYYWEKLDKKSMDKAIEYFELAIKKDPEWADPYAMLASAISMPGTFFRTLPKEVTIPKAYNYRNKALELNPNSAKAHYVKALNAVWTEFDWAQGEEEFLRSLELNPNDALCRMYYSHLLAILQRYDESVIQANLALRRDPLNPLLLGLYKGKNPNDKAGVILHLEKALEIDPDFRFAASRLFNIRMHNAYKNGDYEKWIEMWDKKVRRWKDECKAAVLDAFHENGHIAAIEEMFKVHESNKKDCWMSGAIKAERYIKLNNYDKAMDCLEEEYEIRDMHMTYIATNTRIHDHLKDSPRYIALLKKMNLPHP